MPNDPAERDQPAEVIRRLLEEASRLPKRELTSTRALEAHPWAPGYLLKSPREYDQDNRRGYLLDGLRKVYGGNAEYALQDLSYGRVLGAEADNYQRGRPDFHGNAQGKAVLDSPYYKTGVLGSGSPLSNAGQWFMATPATVYNAGRVMGDAIAPRSQGRTPRQDLGLSFNTLFFEAPEQYGLVPHGTGTIVDVNERARFARGDVPFYQMDRQSLYDMHDKAATNRIRDALPSGEKHLRDQGLPPSVAMWGGMLMDATLDPANGLLAAAKLARAGQGWRAAGVMASDYGIPAALTAAPSMIDLLTPRPEVGRGYR